MLPNINSLLKKAYYGRAEQAKPKFRVAKRNFSARPHQEHLGASLELERPGRVVLVVLAIFHP
jgi:hypothetical protein